MLIGGPIVTETTPSARDGRCGAGSERRPARRLAADGLQVVTLDLHDRLRHLASTSRRDPFPALADIDVCVANGRAVTTTIAPAHRMTAEQWQRDIDVKPDGHVSHRAGRASAGCRERGLSGGSS